MNNISTYRATLEEEKGRLEAELGSVGRRNPANPADWEAVPGETGLEADSTDTAEQIDGYETNTAILKELEARYNDVLRALERIEKGTYGVCTIGGEAIETERLAADPAAKTCKAHLND
mgnify:CR=1 FL=1